jgi:site-specific DNA-methyltransferase (adenine-specific)
MNTLYCGDCLDVLRQFVPDESVDLVYIDPPFNSKQDYNIFFDDKKLQTQRIAFEDTWTYKNVQASLEELHTLEHENLWSLLLVYQKVASHAFPYLVMMALRLLEIHRTLRATGSFYLHCDPTMSHYLKSVCDTIFGGRNFQNEIIWKRSAAHGGAVNYNSIHDTLLYFSKSEHPRWNSPRTSYDASYIKSHYSNTDENGRRYQLVSAHGAGQGPARRFGDKVISPPPNRHWMSQEYIDQMFEQGRVVFTRSGMPRFKRYLDETGGTPMVTVWDDIPPVNSQAQERLGYPTQKPKALLERIIKASSNEGDSVLDAFCGCGTTIDAAESLNRKWIGIDISPMAISLIKRRLRDTYRSKLSPYEVKGIPVDEASAVKLWQENRYAFQDWWLLEFEVFSEGKGADKGIDGVGLYKVGKRANDTLKVAFQVKGGEHISSKDVDALLGILAKFECQAGVFLTIEPPTKPMIETIATSGTVKTPIGMFPILQLLTLEDFFSGKKLKLPAENITFKRAGTHKKEAEQLTL